MGYTNVFGGELIFPSQTSYLRITTAVDVTLVWPREQQIEGNNVVADFLDINASVLGLNIDMPDARSVSTGNKTTINAVGDDFTLRDATGGVIQFATNGTQWVVVLTDNSTEAGTWLSFQLGAGTTLASASALAGSGLQAATGGLLEQIIDSDVEAATPFNVVDGDRAKCLIYTAGAGTANLPAAGAVFNNWFTMIRNSGSGTLNVLPPGGLIDGGASLNLDPNDSAFFFTDGVDYYTIGLSSGSTIAFDFVSLAVPGSGDFVLSGANLDRISYRFTGALTGNRRIIVPNTTQQYWADNQTSGAFTLEVVTAAGAGITVPQGQSVIVYCDGTDVINATSSTSVAFPITIGQGGTSATTVGGAQTNLQVPPDSRLLTAGDGMAGGGDLTADRTFDFDLASIAIAVPDTAADFFVFQDVDNADVNAKALLSTIAGVTIEDEGVPLATLAQTLNFVGAGVVATGAGATKTITINLVEAGTTNDAVLRWNGTAWEEYTNLLLTTAPTEIRASGATIVASPNLFIEESTNNYGWFSAFGAIVSFNAVGTVSQFTMGSWDVFELDSAIKMFELAAPALAPEASYGQLYLRNDAYPVLVLEQDDGNEVPLCEQGSFTIDFDVGFAGANVVTIQYQRTGDVVHITMPIANFGNSNAGTLGTGADWPAALRPASTRYGGTMVTENAAEQVWGVFFLTSGGVLTFEAPNGGDAGDYGNNFNAAGVKGVNGGWSWTYRITDS